MSSDALALLERLYALAWRADFVSPARRAKENSAEAESEIEALCRQHRFLARERAKMVKQKAKLQVVLVQRARRGEPLVPIRVIKANGRVRKFGPSGRAPRRACNARTQGSRRVTRAGPSSDDDPHEQPDLDAFPAFAGRSG